MDLDVEFTRGIVGLLTLVIVGFTLRQGIKKISPDKLEGRNFLISLVDFTFTSLIQATEGILGRKLTEKHSAFLCFLFLSILSVNLVGLIPGMPAPSMSPMFVLGLALISFIYFNYNGIKEHGLGYFKHMASPLIDMGLPFKVIALGIFFIELISVIVRIFTLTVRLVIAITVDHKLLDNFVNSDIGIAFGFIPVASLLYFFGLFVSFIQAYIFFFLNKVYIFLACSHESDEH